MKIAVLPGDDIGPEITDAALGVLEAVDVMFGLGLEYEMHEVGIALHRKIGTTITPEIVAAAKRADGILLGPAGMTAYPPLSDGGINIPGTIRRQLDLFANLRPARSRPGVPKAHPGVDCLIVRENTEGFYADRTMFQGNGEFMPTPDLAIAVRKITAQASRRIAKVAFDMAKGRRSDVTSVGKQHVLQLSDGLFMREVEAEAALNPGVAYRELDVDAMAADIYLNPARFDVILTTNMFGDILSNLVVALSGGLGLAGALNVGTEHAAANAGHGSAPDIAGQGIANPTGIILSSALLLRWLGSRHNRPEYSLAAAAIENSLDVCLGNAASRTGDLGGSGTTKIVGAKVCENLREKAAA